MKYTADDVEKLYQNYKKEIAPKTTESVVRKNSLPIKKSGTFTADDVEKIYQNNLKANLPTKASSNKAVDFVKTAGYRSAAEASNTADALTYLKKYKMADNADNLEKRIQNAGRNNIAIPQRQKMYLQASKSIDKDKLVNQTDTTKNLLNKASENEQRLKKGNGPVANTLIDIGLAGTDMLGKAGISALTGAPLPAIIGVTSGAEKFQEGINEGKDIDTALKLGAGSGAISGGIESLTGIGASKASKIIGSKAGKALLGKLPSNISGYLTKAGESTIGKVLKDAAGEGLEEGLEYDAQRVYRNILLDEDTPRDIREQAYNMLIGAGVGGLFGGAQAIRNVIPRQNNNQPSINSNEQLTDVKTQNNDLPTIKKKRGYSEEWETYNPYIGENPFEEEHKLLLNKHEKNESKLEEWDAYAKKYNQWEMEQVLNDKPAYLGNPIYNDIAKQFAENNRLKFGTAKSNVNGEIMPIVAKDEASLNRVIKAVENNYFEVEQQRELGFALGYKDMRPSKQTNAVGINTKSKAEKYQSRQEKYFIESISDSLGISKFADKTSLKGKVNELTNELKNGTATPEKIDNLFNTILEDGIQVDFTYYNQYRPLKESIRNSRIFVSDNIKNEFDKGEYNNFRRTNLGNLTLAKDGVPVDSYYQELTQTNPELFPEDITNPTEQLRRIAEVQNSIVATENNLNMYIDDNGVFKQGARIEFDKALDKLTKEAEQVKKVQDEKIAKQEAKEIDAEMVKNSNAESMKQIYELNKQYQKEYDKVMSKEILIDRDKVYVDRLVKGEITVEDLPKDVNKGGIIKVAQAKEPLENIKKSIKDYNKAHKQFLRDEADMLTENSMSWKEKKSGFQYQRETMERNIRDIVPDKKEAAYIVNTYFTPVHENEANSTKMKNEYRDRIRKLNLSDEAKYEVAFETKKGGGLPNVTKVSERALVQLLGENVITKEMVKGSGADVAKIEKAVNEFRQIYNDLIVKSNDVLIENGYAPVDYRKDYFPHFQEDATDNLLGKLGRMLGIEVNTKELPTDIAGMTHIFKPGKKWVGNFLQRTTDETVYDAVEGFDRYIEGVSDVIHHTGDIQRLRAFEESIRYNYSSDGIKAEIDKIRENDNMDETDKRNRIEELYQIDKNKFPYLVTELRNYTDNLAGKKSISDRTMEHRLGRGMYEISKAMENRVAANMVALNPGSWITNFIPLAQGLGGVKSTNMFNGMKDTIKSYGKGDSIVDKSTFLTNRRGSEPLVMTKIQKASKVLSSPMQIIDNFTAESLVRAKYYDNMNKGMKEDQAMRNADKWAAGVMADRSKGALPTIFNDKNPVTKTLTMFQTEVNNQLSYLFKDVPDELKEEGIKAIALAFTKIFIASWLYNELYEKVTGRRAALDPIDIVTSSIGDFADEDKTTYQAIANTSKNLVEEVPFVGGLIGGGRLPISSALPSLTNTVKAGVGLASGEMPANKALQTLGKEAAKPISYLAFPFGGGQVKKAVEGIGTVAKGGSYGIDSEGRETLQFPAEKTAGNYIKSSVFGKYSLPKAQDYIDSGFKSLSGPYTEKYKDALKKGFTSDEFLNTYEAQKKAQSEKDSKGETIYLSLAKNKKKAIDEANKGMSKEKLEQLYVYFDVSEKVWKQEEKKTDKKSSLPTIIGGIKFNTTLPTIKDKE